jgi:hypothetical protein
MQQHKSYRIFIVVLLGAILAAAQDLSFKIPPLATSVKIANQPVEIVASGLISKLPSPSNETVLRIELSADLADLQQRFTPILQAQLDKNDRCGDRIQIQRAGLAPLAPATSATAYLHVERWACVKVFGKQVPNKLVAGNAVVDAKLTPSVADNTLRLTPEVGRIQADGSLGELLRSGELGARLREKIRTSLLAALQKGTDFKATLPPAIQDYATLNRVEFRDIGSGRLAVAFDGQVQITNQQIQLLREQLKARRGRAQ